MTKLKKVPPQNNTEIVTQTHKGTLTTCEEERVQVWKDKKAKADMGFSYKLGKKKDDSQPRLRLATSPGTAQGTLLSSFYLGSFI